MALTVFLVVIAFVIVIILAAIITPNVGWTTPRHRSDSRRLKPKPTITYSEDKGPFETKQHPGIRIDKIPVGGLAGLVFVIGALAIFLIGIPQIRRFFPVMVVGGLVGAGLLYWWRNQTRFASPIPAPAES